MASDPSSAEAAVERIRILLRDQHFDKQLHAKRSESLNHTFEAFRLSAQRINVLRCLYDVFRKLPEPIRLRESDIVNISKFDGWPYPAISREVLSSIADGETSRPHISNVKSLLFAIFVLKESNHPATSQPISRALLDALPELPMFHVGQKSEDAELYLRQRRGEDLYAFIGNPIFQPSLASCVNSPLLNELNHDETSVPQMHLTAVRPSARGPRGGSGFVISHAQLSLISRNEGGEQKLYIHIITNTGKGDKIDIKSSGFVIPNNGGDLYLMQHQQKVGSFNITAVPQEQLSLPGGFSRGLILTYDAQNNEGIMATKIALIKGKPDNIPMINDASWKDTKIYFELIPKIDVDFDEMVKYLVSLDASFVMGDISNLEEGDGLDFQDFSEIYRNLDDNADFEETETAVCMLRPINPFNMDSLAENEIYILVKEIIRPQSSFPVMNTVYDSMPATRPQSIKRKSRISLKV